MRKTCWLEADYLHAHASKKDFELFISEEEKQPAIWDPRHISIQRENLNKSAFTQAKACTQKQASNVNGALAFAILAGANPQRSSVNKSTITFIQFEQKYDHLINYLIELINCTVIQF